MKTVELALLFIWISLCCGRVLLTGGNRRSFCSLPKETGVCRGYFLKWYYNINSGKCELFTYGGCGGNENNFDTKDECEGNCTTNTGKEGHPSQLLKLFARKNARITDKTSVIFRKRFRRDLNIASSHTMIDDHTSSETNPEKQPKNGADAVKIAVRPSKSQGGSQSKTASSSSKPGTLASNRAPENSSDTTSSETNYVNQTNNGSNAVRTTVSPSKPQAGSPSQSISSSSKSGAPASNLAPENSLDQTSSETNLVNKSNNGGDAEETTVPPSESQSESTQNVSSSSKPGAPASNLAPENSLDQTSSETNLVNQSNNGRDAEEITVPPSESQGGSQSETVSSSSKPGAPALNLTPENSSGQTSSETNLVNHGKNKGNDGKSETQPGGKKEKVKSVLSSTRLESGNKKSSHRKGELSVETESPTKPPDKSSEKMDGFPFHPEQGTKDNVEEDDLDFSHYQTFRKDSAVYPYEHTSSHFAAFFLTSIVMVFAAYVVYHNRQKIIAIVIEGRSDGNGRRRGYRKLESNVEEVMPTLTSSNSTYVY